MENLENQDQVNNVKPSKGILKIIKKILIWIIVLSIIGFIGYIAFNLYFHNEFFNHQNVLQSRPDTDVLKQNSIFPSTQIKARIKKFKSEEDFKEYLALAGSNSSSKN